MINQKLNTIKTNLVKYVAYCYQKDNNHEVDYVINNFLFDNITDLQDLQTLDEEQVKAFTDYSSEDQKIAAFVKNSLGCFVTKLADSRANEPVNYNLEITETGFIENVFSGLKFYPNNNTDYKNLLSLLALSSFRI